MEGEGLSSPSDKTILIVDDDPEMVKLLDLTLRREGFQVVSAGGGVEAAEKVAQEPPDLIITDVMMPGQGGYEFLRNLQAEGASSIPVFVISAGNLNQSTVDMIRQEANVLEFIPKPVPMASFIASLHRVLKTTPPELGASQSSGPS